jgi:hypothetical protein
MPDDLAKRVIASGEMASIVERLKRRKATPKPTDWIRVAHGVDEIVNALSIPSSVALITLIGLIATGNVRARDLDPEECSIAELQRAEFVSRSDLAEWLEGYSLGKRDAVIAKLIRNGANPPRTQRWKDFCNLVRNQCDGWYAKGTPAWGFGDRQIQRAVKALRAV